MKFEYTFEGMKLKVLDETFAGKVLEFYSSNREEFDRYEAAKPDNFYTTEYIAATLKAEYAALLRVNSADFSFFLTTYQVKFSALYLFLVLQALTVLAA